MVIDHQITLTIIYPLAVISHCYVWFVVPLKWILSDLKIWSIFSSTINEFFVSQPSLVVVSKVHHINVQHFVIVTMVDYGNNQQHKQQRPKQEQQTCTLECFPTHSLITPFGKLDNGTSAIYSRWFPKGFLIEYGDSPAIQVNISYWLGTCADALRPCARLFGCQAWPDDGEARADWQVPA